MDNYTIICLMLITAGILLGCIVIFSITNRNKSDSTIESIDERLNLSVDYPPEPDTDRIRTPINIIGRDVNRIYAYAESDNKAAHIVWVCRDCETENKMECENCILCGAMKVI